MNELQKLMDDIREWSDATFGDGQRNPAIVYHLKREVPELIEAIKIYANKVHLGEECSGDVHKVGYEFADCFMLLLDSASHFGLTAGNLLWYTEEKLKINKAREWGKPDENGVVEHIPEPADKEYICKVCGKVFHSSIPIDICATCYI